MRDQVLLLRKTNAIYFVLYLLTLLILNQELAVLADRIEWDYFEEAFAGHYSHTGQSAMPIRFMVGCLLLKRIYDYGDETLAITWVMNPYMRQSHLYLGAVFLRAGLFQQVCSLS